MTTHVYYCDVTSPYLCRQQIEQQTDKQQRDAEFDVVNLYDMLIASTTTFYALKIVYIFSCQHIEIYSSKKIT